MQSCLIVEPNRMIRAILRKIMEDLRFECLQADDAAGAIAKAQQELPDLLILEWDLPTSRGAEVLQAVKALPGGDKVRTIFCAAQTDPELIAGALAMGADDFIMKPFDAEIVRGKLDYLGLLA